MASPRRSPSPFRGDTGIVLRAILAAAVLATPALAVNASAQAAPEAVEVTSPPPAKPAAKRSPQTRNQLRTTGPAQFRSLEIIGHRGARDLGPENTLQGIASAFRAGANAVEFDVNFTRDEHIVLLHDWTLDRTTNCSGNVTRQTWAQVSKCRTTNGKPLPSLASALAEVSKHGGKAYIHTKRADNSRQARKLLQAVRSSGLGSRATIIASVTPVLERLEKAGGRRLGYVFNNRAGWKTHYPVLIPFNVPITKDLVAKAQRRGQFVAAVESRPLGVGQLRNLGLNGFLANHLETTMWKLAGAPPGIRDNRVQSESPADSGWTETHDIRGDRADDKRH